MFKMFKGTFFCLLRNCVLSLFHTYWTKSSKRNNVIRNVTVLFYTSEPPKDDGGTEITKYVVELSEGLSGM